MSKPKRGPRPQKKAPPYWPPTKDSTPKASPPETPEP